MAITLRVRHLAHNQLRSFCQQPKTILILQYCPQVMVELNLSTAASFTSTTIPVCVKVHY
ncbi:hypothetical protein FRX31_023272 [Thalictrum thalictroides]|uniref:Uncharacterized protein n=1 Tax=Thalictrum thalictroides TaxID=46969 RepID=A0A7J6VPV4_THATH|nr:hypothetical protein FRX31_023272 [Thalictrum thalictroides]